jgi:hypothetical protein
MMGEKRKTPEKIVQDACVEHLKISGWKTQRNQQGMGNTKGRLDYEAIKEFKGIGITIYIEFKGPKGRLSRDQVEYIRGLRDVKAIVCVCKSLEEFINDLLRIEYKIKELLK